MRLAIPAIFALAILAGQAGPADGRLVVHEWGTFTSVAGEDGVALDWRPLRGRNDLPSFVHAQCKYKCNLVARVRMETPVLYFYAGRETEVSVQVGFPRGQITEWYPRGRQVGGGIAWSGLTVLPGAAPAFPVEAAKNHYYAARETDAAPIRVRDQQCQEFEKFLFYRGAGTFDLPLSAKLVGGEVVVKNTRSEPIAAVILFENTGGRMGYRIVEGLNDQASLSWPALNADLSALRDDLEKILVRQGLYQREARAMVETWRDSWFEEGMRVFYVVPRAITDEVLPIVIEPPPAELVRVLVGRAELISPQMENLLLDRLTGLRDESAALREAAAEVMTRHGRFAEPLLKRALLRTQDADMRARVDRLLRVSETF